MLRLVWFPVRGLEGIVSKRLGAPYRSGPSRDWAEDQEPGQPCNAAAAGGHVVRGQMIR
jgi:hypothetical protein